MNLDLEFRVLADFKLKRGKTERFLVRPSEAVMIGPLSLPERIAHKVNVLSFRVHLHEQLGSLAHPTRPVPGLNFLEGFTPVNTSVMYNQDIVMVLQAIEDCTIEDCDSPANWIIGQERTAIIGRIPAIPLPGKREVDINEASKMLGKRIDYLRYRGKPVEEAIKMAFASLKISLDAETERVLVKSLRDAKLAPELRQHYDAMMANGDIEIEGISDREYQDLERQVNAIKKGVG